MKRIIYIGLLLAIAIGAHAEIVVLQSGKTMEGEIMLQNEDIVMLRDKEGRKFQFPMQEVVEIRQSEPISENKQATTSSSKKGNCALRLDLSGGALFVPSLSNGGFGAVDIQIGTRHIGSQRMFLGGSIGYQAAVADKAYNFLPLMVAFSIPLLSGKHAPEIGTALGYGFAINNPSKGGIAARLDISWRYQFKAHSALLLGVQTRFQQAQVSYKETIEKKEYSSTLGRNFVSLGVRLALEF